MYFTLFRLFKGGLLKTLPAFAEFNMKDLLPLKIERPDEGCIRSQLTVSLKTLNHYQDKHCSKSHDKIFCEPKLRKGYFLPLRQGRHDCAEVCVGTFIYKEVDPKKSARI